MAKSKEIPRDRWQEFCATFTNGNRRRATSIEVLGSGRLLDGAPLLGVTFDPVGKGNDITLTTGKDSVEFAHSVNAPTELWEAQADDGRAQALEIVDQNGVKTVVSFGE